MTETSPVEKVEKIPEQPFTWTVCQHNRDYGPYSRSDLLKLIFSKQIIAQATIRRNDWNEFRSVIDCLDMIGQAQNQVGTSAKSLERRIAAPRVPINGIASACNDRASITCITSNLSTTGIFLKTGETCFRIGDKVEIIVKVEHINKPFQAKAEVMRFSTNLTFGVGYGLKFLDIENNVISEIRNIVGVRPISEFGDFLSSPAAKPAPAKV